MTLTIKSAVACSALMLAALPCFGSGNMVVSTDSVYAVGLETTDDGISVRLEIPEGMARQRALINGVTLYLDPKGKENTKYSVQFPSAQWKPESKQADNSGESGDFQPPQPPQGDGQEGAPGQPPAMPDQPYAKPAKPGIPERQMQMMVASMAGEQSSFYADDEERMIPHDNATVAVENGMLVYSCYLPWSWIGLKKFKKGDYTVGVLIREPERQGMPPGGRGGKGDKMGNPPSGGPGGGMGGPGGGPGGRGGRGGMGAPGGMGGRGGMGGPGGGDRQAPDMKQKSGNTVDWVSIPLD